MLGASWVDGHSIAALAAQHNQLLNALLLAAERSKVGLLCGKQQLRPCAVVAPRRAFPLQKSPPAPREVFAMGDQTLFWPKLMAQFVELMRHK